MICVGDKIRITWKDHWGFGQKFIVTGRPHVSLRCIDLGRLVEFESPGPTINGLKGHMGKHCVPPEWCAVESNSS